MARTANLTIMFTDIVGFTSMTSNQSRVQNQRMLRRHDSLLLPVVARYGGRKIKSIGDALLLVFRSPTDAARCGMALHDVLAEDNAKRDEKERLHIRVAINVGEVLLERGDVFGEAVNVAARVESLTPADEIYLTEAVYLSMNKAEVAAEKVSTEQLKGIPEAITIYRVPPHKISRLVPAGEEIEEAPGELPFGGMHHVEIDAGLVDRIRWQAANQAERLTAWASETIPKLRNLRLADLRQIPIRTRVIALLVVLFTSSVIAASYHWRGEIGDWTRAALGGDNDGYQSARDSALLTEAESLIRQGRQHQARELATAEIAENADNPEAHLILGHLEFAKNKRKSGTEYYRKAASLDPTLLQEPRAVANMVNGLGWVTREVSPLILQVDTPMMIDRLAKRSGSPGYYGRQAAIALLDQMGYSHRVDRVGAAIEDLKGRERCEDREKAVVQLRKLQDRRAIPVLKEIVESNFMNRLQNACLMAEARNALEELGGK